MPAVKIENGKKPRFTRRHVSPSKENGGFTNERGHLGWCNSATWCFNQYFFQEREFYEAFYRLYKSKELNVDSVRLLFAASKVQIDDDCVGSVCIPEIIDNFILEQQ